MRPGAPRRRHRPGGFEEVAFDALETYGTPEIRPMIGVGVARLVRAPAAGLPGERIFTFRART